MRRRLATIAVTVLAAVAAGGASARAGAPTRAGKTAHAGSAAARAKAKALFRAGERAFDDDRYGAAAEAFEEAYRQLPLPAIAFSAAQAYRIEYAITKKPAQLRRAVELYRLYIRVQKHGGRIHDAAGFLSDLAPLLAQMTHAGVDVAAPAPSHQTRLVLLPDVAGATGKIDGKRGLDAVVAPGEHTIEVDAAGYFPTVVKARAVSGTSTDLVVHLKPRPALLDVRAPSGAEVAIDARPLGTAPLRPTRVPVGRHVVSITERGKVPLSRELDFGRGKTTVLHAELRTTGQRWAARWVLIGAGALAVGSGVAAGMAIASDSQAADLEAKLAKGGQLPSTLDRYDQLRGERDSRAQVAWILGGTAVAAAATGAILYIFDHRTPELAAARPPQAGVGLQELELAPAVGPAGAGVILGGMW